MKKHPLFIRADASSEIGTGHVMRMLALAQAWGERSGCAGVGEYGSRGVGEYGSRRVVECGGSSTHQLINPSTNQVLFICAELPETLEARLKEEGFDVARINAIPGSPDDLAQTLSILNANTSTPPYSDTPIPSHPLWLVTDGYAFDVIYQRAIRKAGYKLMVVDDYNHLPEYECDILLNQNIGAEEYEYHVNPEAKLLLGTRYVLLRREFRQAVSRAPKTDTLSAHHSSNQSIPLTTKNQEPRTKNLLITMGGADRNNVTLKVIEALNRVEGTDLNVKVLVGAANPHIETLKKAVLAPSRINYQLINHSPDMPALMQWVDLAITAGGSTCWEFCLFQVPMILIVLAENQQRIVDRLIAAGAGRYGKEWGMINPAELATEIENMIYNSEIRNHVVNHAGVLVDQYGSMRICEAIAPTPVDELALRATRPDDVILYFHWVNDPAVRASAINSELVSWDEHCKWFRSRLNDKGSFLSVMEAGKLPVGQVRFDVDERHVAWLDYSLDLVVRGRGWGQHLIQLGLQEFQKSHHLTVCARVKQENEVSSSVLVQAGFCKVSDGIIRLYDFKKSIQ